MNKTTAIEKLEKLRNVIPGLKARKSGNAEFKKWYRDVEVAIANIFKDNKKPLEDFNSVSYSLSICTSSTPDHVFDEAYRDGLDQADSIMRSLIGEVEEYWDEEDVVINQRIEWKNIFDRFHKVATRLRKRYNARPPLEVEDEYDVQDLSYSLLHLFFDDIRKEEWTPSYAGAASRVDFLIKEIKTVIEIKKTRKGLSDKEIGEQLIIDIARYKAHPECQTLVCFVYDPEGRISNPEGLTRDLTKSENGLSVDVIIRPIGI